MKKSVAYFVDGLIVFVVASLICVQRGLFAAESATSAFHILSDGFFVSGILFAGIGLLGLAASKGTYDMLSFGFGRVFRNFIPTMNRDRYEHFYEYKEEKEQRKRKWTPTLTVCGSFALACSVLFLILYSIC